MQLSKKIATASLVITCGLFAVQNVFAASSVFFDSDTGGYGYSYQAKNLTEARKTALKYCEEAKGTNCKELVSSIRHGWGAIAEGTTTDGVPTIGAMIAAGTEKQAKDGAIRYCKSAGGHKVKITYTWKDK